MKNEIKIHVKSVKDFGDTYLLNSNMYVPKEKGNKEYEAIQEWIKKGNEVEPRFSQEEIFEQQKNMYIRAIDALVQEQINQYNKAKLTVFTDVKSCAIYASHPKQRTHTPFCKWIWTWKDDIFDFAGNELIKIQNGQRQMPSSQEELLDELLKKHPLKTQEFIGD